MKLRTTLLMLSALGSGCAARQPAVQDDWSNPPPTSHSTPRSPEGEGQPRSENRPALATAPVNRPGTAGFDAKAYATTFPQQVGCEEAARSLQPVSRDHAWQLLKACVARENFSMLKPLIGDAWAEDLRTRREAPTLLAKPIARRGGSIDRDISELQKARVPLFTLAAAMAQPNVFKGRYIVLRGKVDDLRAAKGGAMTVTIAEYAVSGQLKESRTQGPVAQWRGGRSRSGGNSAYRDDFEVKRQFVSDNTSEETGREALGRLAKADPFLQPDKEFIILARFDGVRSTDDGESEGEAAEQAILTLYSYFEPSSMVVF
jgi:hypothetical protein